MPHGLVLPLASSKLLGEAPSTRGSYLADSGQLVLEVFDSIVFGIQHILQSKNIGLLKLHSRHRLQSSSPVSCGSADQGESLTVLLGYSFLCPLPYQPPSCPASEV